MRHGIHRGAVGAVVILAACGGGGSPSSPSSPSYPAVKGIYGSYVGSPDGASHQRWTAPDGTVTTQDCWAVTSIPTQNGAQFSGNVDRVAPCSSQATLAGTVAADGSITFTLTQARWGSCTMTGGGQYSGVVNLGSLLANGRVTVLCDDGRAMTVEEQLTGSLPIPPTTPG
ncbi:MAG TPA: hypothetical protein VMT70_02710 [Vicinamibacteria bacterium]|nr:hypothetical protein [Vicinamibacteria bacterium]